MAHPLLQATQAAVDLYWGPELSLLDDGEPGSPAHAEPAVLKARCISTLAAVSTAAGRADAPGVALPPALLGALASMVRDASGAEVNSTRASVGAAALCYAIGYPHNTSAPRIQQMIAHPGFVEAVAAALARWRSGSPPAGYLCIFAAELCCHPGVCEGQHWEAAAALARAPGDPLATILGVAQTVARPCGAKGGYEAMLLAARLCERHLPAAARCAADGGFLAAAAAAASPGDLLAATPLLLLARLADADHPDVSELLLAGPQAEAVVGAAAGCLRRRLDPDPGSEAVASTWQNAATILAAAFRSAATAAAALRAAAAAAADLVPLARLKAEGSGRWQAAADAAAFALAAAAASDAAWAVPLPDSARGWWAAHLSASCPDPAAEAPLQEDSGLSPAVLSATQAALAVARRGAARAWRLVEQRPAALDALGFQLLGTLRGADALPSLGTTGGLHLSDRLISLLDAPTAALLALLAREGTVEQRRLMIRRPKFLETVAAAVEEGFPLISSGGAGGLDAEPLVSPLRAKASSREEATAEEFETMQRLGLELYRASLADRPEAVSSGAILGAATEAAIDALRVLDALTGAGGADGDAACDALLAASPAAAARLLGWLRAAAAGAGPSAGGPEDPQQLLCRVSRRLQARRGASGRGSSGAGAGAAQPAAGGARRPAATPVLPPPTPQPQQEPQQWQAGQPEQQLQQAAAGEHAAAGQAAPAVDACATCGKTAAEGARLKRCPGCKLPAPKFCSNSCYNAGWPAHMAVCKAACMAACAAAQRAAQQG